jgi:hypothetical protein
MTDDLQILIVGGTRRGRPPKAGVRASAFVRIRATEGQKNDLREVAKSEGRTMADVIRDAIDSYVGDFRERVIFTPSGDRFPPRDET